MNLIITFLMNSFIEINPNFKNSFCNLNSQQNHAETFIYIKKRAIFANKLQKQEQTLQNIPLPV